METLRKERRERLDKELETMAEAGSGLGSLKRLWVKQAGSARITCITDAAGNEHSDQDSICEAFAAFYEELYRDADGVGFKAPDSEAPLAEISQAFAMGSAPTDRRAQAHRQAERSSESQPECIVRLQS